MNILPIHRLLASVLTAILIAVTLMRVTTPEACAYPPAPHHTLYGMVRDEFGNPLRGNVEIILETSAGTQVKGHVATDLEPGVNYQVKVAMDAGLTSDAYKPTALRPTVPFKLRVRVGDVTYLPIQMTGNYRNLGLAGQRTRIDLTLGEDLDGDGLPDAWERLINPDITKVNPGDDSDRDGLTNLQEYVAGTYAFDPEHGFALNIVGVSGNAPLLEFTAIRNRTYTIQGSSDLKQWTTVSFRVLAEGTNALQRYGATDVRLLRAEVPPVADGAAPRFFRLVVE